MVVVLHQFGPSNPQISFANIKEYPTSAGTLLKVLEILTSITEDINYQLTILYFYKTLYILFTLFRVPASSSLERDKSMEACIRFPLSPATFQLSLKYFSNIQNESLLRAKAISVSIPFSPASISPRTMSSTCVNIRV